MYYLALSVIYVKQPVWDEYCLCGSNLGRWPWTYLWWIAGYSAAITSTSPSVCLFETRQNSPRKMRTYSNAFPALSTNHLESWASEGFISVGGQEQIFSGIGQRDFSRGWQQRWNFILLNRNYEEKFFFQKVNKNIVKSSGFCPLLPTPMLGISKHFMIQSVFFCK